MRFTIERKRLGKMLESVRRPNCPGKKKRTKKGGRLYACAAIWAPDTFEHFDQRTSCRDKRKRTKRCGCMRVRRACSWRRTAAATRSFSEWTTRRSAGRHGRGSEVVGLK